MKHWIILFLALTGCGPKIQVSGFEKYVDKFERVGNIKIIELVIQFDYLEDSYAYCDSAQLFSWNTITIDKETWDLFGETEREMIIFHEMGHCVLNRIHEFDLMGDCPKSLMIPFNDMPKKCYVEMEPYYLTELFKE